MLYKEYVTTESPELRKHLKARRRTLADFLSADKTLHTVVEPAVHAAVKNLVSYRNDTKTAFFFAAS